MRRVTGPGYDCNCKSEPETCPPCSTTEARTKLYRKYQLARLPISMPGAVKHEMERTRWHAPIGG
jgi:hypothetical protein